MSHADLLLDKIEECIVQHGGDLGGWTRREGDSLQLFDGRVSLRATVDDPELGRDGIAHAHVLTTLHEHDDEVLDACMFGMGDDREQAIGEAAFLWATCVAGPVRSFIDNKPVCMTCQAGVHDGDISQGYSPGDYGLPGMRAFVGPSVARGFDAEGIQSQIDDTKPWFRFAAESAAPRRVHLVKASIVSHGRDGWDRNLEVDGHDVSYHDPNWPAGVTGPDAGYLTRFAVFEFPPNSVEIRKRAELERTIIYFAENYAQHESVDALMTHMAEQGFDADAIHQVESLSTIAFGRFYFENAGVQYSPTIIRARADGSVETDVPLMSLPAYTRARALAAKLAQAMPEDDFAKLCFYNAESGAILQAVEAHGDEIDLSKMSLYPCVVPDRNVSNQTMDAALTHLEAMVSSKQPVKKKPWWKFW